MRVLHVVGSLNRGGTETWLLALFKEMESDDRVQHEVVIQRRPDSGGYEEAVEELGIPIHCIPRDVVWPIRMYRLFRSLSRHDLVHSHRDEFSAVVLPIALLARVPRRIAQNHNDHTQAESALHRVYRHVCKAVLRVVATDRVAVSRGAQASLFGQNPNASTVIYCGLDIHRYAYDSASRRRVRQEMGVGDDVPVLLHIGGFRHQKNQAFLIDVFRDFRNRYQPSAELWFVGDGVDREEIEGQVAANKLDGVVRFLGVRPDVPALLSSADMFVFPSLYEGLGLAAVEAQASGMPVVVSDAVPGEAVVVPELVTSKSLSEDSLCWAETIDRLYRERRDRYIESSRLTRFDIKSNARMINKLYGLID